MAIANQHFWDKYPETRVPRKDEPSIPYVDFAKVWQILRAFGQRWKDEELPVLTRDDILAIRCSDNPRANVMRFEGKWYALTKPQRNALAKGVWGDGGDGRPLLYVSV